MLKTQEDVTINFKAATSDYGELVVPAGTRVTHNTAMGSDDKYNFVNDFDWLDKDKGRMKQAEEAGMDIKAFNELIKSDMSSYGLNIPGQFCVDAGKMKESFDVLLKNNSGERFVEVEFVSYWIEGDIYTTATLDTELGVVSNIVVSDNGAEYETLISQGIIIKSKDGHESIISVNDSNINSDTFLIDPDSLERALNLFYHADAGQSAQPCMG